MAKVFSAYNFNSYLILLILTTITCFDANAQTAEKIIGTWQNVKTEMIGPEGVIVENGDLGPMIDTLIFKEDGKLITIQSKTPFVKTMANYSVSKNKLKLTNRITATELVFDDRVVNIYKLNNKKLVIEYGIEVKSNFKIEIEEFFLRETFKKIKH